MNPEHLRYYLAFAEAGSLHSAARQVGRSPAALSKALRQLQTDSGRTLVAARGRGLLLTAEGREFARRAKEALRLLDGLAGPLVATPRRLRLGTFEVFSTHWLPELVDSGEDGEIELRELGPGSLELALRDGVVDVGITYSPVPTRGVEARRLGDVPMKIFARKGAFRGRNLADLPFAAPLPPKDRSPTRVEGLDGWPPTRPRRVVAWVTSLETALALLRAGRCVAYLPEPLVERHNRVVQERYRLVPVTTAERVAGAERTQAFLLLRSGEPADPRVLSLELRLSEALARGRKS